MMIALTRYRERMVFGILAAMLLAGCGGPEGSPEEQVRAWVKQGVAAADSKDRGALMDMVSSSYADSRGNRRDDLNNLLRFHFLRQEKVAFITRIDELTVHGESAADLVLQVGMAGTNDNALGFSADAYRIEMELEREGDDWLLIAARWGGLGDEVF
jgi:hypothetical protein